MLCIDFGICVGIGILFGFGWGIWVVVVWIWGGWFGCNGGVDVKVCEWFRNEGEVDFWCLWGLWEGDGYVGEDFWIFVWLSVLLLGLDVMSLC